MSDTWDFYKFLWKHIGGRPWTYILRDAWHKVEGLWIIGMVLVGAVLGHFYWHMIVWFLIVFSVGYIAGHLFWGKDYIPGQRVQDKDVKE
jgi:hypothetical protein